MVTRPAGEKRRLESEVGPVHYYLESKDVTKEASRSLDIADTQ